MNHSARVISNQSGVYDRLEEVITKYLTTEYRAPIALHTQEVFQNLDIMNISEPLILDLGCGTGMSTYNLAEQYPNSFVIGIDKSEDRLTKYNSKMLPNMKLVRADIFPFLQLCAAHKVEIEMITVFYPNPWPKADYFKRRMHGHPVFPLVFPYVKHWWLRTNWDIYAQEFALGYGVVSGNDLEVKKLKPGESYMTLFEKKYTESGHDLWEVKV